MDYKMKHSLKLAYFLKIIQRLVSMSVVVGTVLSDVTITGSQLEKFQLCLADTNADISYPSNDTWWYDSQIIYVPVLRHPIAVAYAQSTSQVQELVKCATKHQVKISPRSGGHSYEAFSNDDDRLVIDVSRIDFVIIDDDGLNNGTRTATVGAGIRLGRLYYEIGKHQMVFPAGRCTTVGLAGQVASGGIGYLTRLWGLAADNVLELEMVDWRGTVLVANAESNQDLFFALRGGGGGSYGIVTTTKLKIYPNPPLSTAFTINWNQPINVSDFSKAWFKWKPWDSAPRELSFQVFFSKATVMAGIYVGEDGPSLLERTINASGLLEVGPEGSQKYQYYSSKDLLAARAWLDNNNVHYGNDSDYHIYNTPSSFIFKPLDLPPYATPVHPTWAQIQNDTRVNMTHLDNSVGTTGPIPNQEPLRINHDYRKYTSQIFVKEFHEAAYKALEEYVSHDGAIVQFKPFGGIIYTIPEDFNAYPHRRQLFLLQYFTPYYPIGTHRPSGIDGQNEMSRRLLAEMEPYTKSYQGYPDLFWTTDPKIYMPRYYGNHVERLVQAKVKYDPKDYFSNKQSTPIAL